MNVLRMIAFFLISFFVGILMTIYLLKRSSKRRGKRSENFIDRFGTMNLILVIVGVIFVTFTVTMIVLFCHYGAVPDTLVTCVFGVLGGECGVMGWIRTAKERRQDRKWQKEDMKERMRNNVYAETDPPGSGK